MHSPLTPPATPNRSCSNETTYFALWRQPSNNDLVRSKLGLEPPSGIDIEKLHITV
jgi:hypothetical protein